MTRIIGYTRCSTAGQEASGLGLDAQRDAIASEAARRDWDVEWICDPAASGKTINAGLREALDLCETGQADGIAVARMDRLARSVAHAADIVAAAERGGWRLIVLDLNLDLGTPAGRAMAHMLATFGEFERAMISTRTKDALAARKRAGLPVGRKRLASPEVVRRIVVERESGRSYRAIAADLSTAGVLSPEGRPVWQESTVRRLYAATKVVA